MSVEHRPTDSWFPRSRTPLVLGVALLVAGTAAAVYAVQETSTASEPAPAATTTAQETTTAPETATNSPDAAKQDDAKKEEKVVKTDAEWRKQLTPDQYRVTRKQGTEAAYSGELWDEHGTGTYTCVCCGQKLFRSETKFKSGTGWPSFYKPLPDAVATRDDNTLFTRRTEVHCDRCAAHLGHVFEDGPKPTGLRYCMNSVSLKFKSDDAKNAKDKH